MKRFIAITAILLITFTAGAQEGKRMYKRYSNNNDVSAVYISPSMYKLIGKIPALRSGDSDFDITNLIESFDGFYMINSTDPETGREIRSDVEKFVQNKNYETLMEVKDKGQKMNIYTCGNDNTIKSLVLISNTVDECVFISLDGVISRSKLEKLITEQNVISYKQATKPNIVILE